MYIIMKQKKDDLKYIYKNTGKCKKIAVFF